MKTFTTMNELKNYLESACQKAIENAAERLLVVLQQYINDDYYNLYKPKLYKRTLQFYDSAVTNMLSSNTAEIKMDDTLMNYKNLDGSDGTWTGIEQLYMAEAGFHGNVSIYRDGHFWKDFETYCNEHAVDILREELIKQGLNIK